MSVAAARPVRDDGLIRTTLRIGAGLSEASLAAVVHALQRVPGVLTVDADANIARAFVAHDEAVPTTSLVAAVQQAGSAATAVVVAGAVVASAGSDGMSQTMPRRPLLSAAGFVAVLAVIFIDVAFANSPEKRWLLIIPVVVLWTFVSMRAILTRRS